MTRRVLAIAPIALAACAPEAANPPAAAHHRHHDGPGHHHHDGAGHHDGPLVHRFQNAEQWAKEFDDPARDAWQRPAAVVAALEIAPGMTVADVGAGTGYFLPHLSRAVGPKGKVIGLDIETDMVSYMQKRIAREGLANAEARVVPLDDPKLAPGSMDRVLIVDTWHHIDHRPAYAAKLAAALAPGGAVFVVDFKRDAKRGPPPEHRIPPEQVMDELKKGGLIPEIVDVALPEQYVVLGKR